MNLDPRFGTRRPKVIEPAVSRTIENDKSLKLVRVDIQKFCAAHRTGSGNAVVSELIERIGYYHQLLEIFSKNELSLSKGIRIDII
jgi:Holliday junction resolvasome RuvABC ATP-dependent DNA helicase subunit